MSTLATLGARVRERRRALGLTQAQLGAVSGTNEAAVSSFEGKGVRWPTTLEALADALGVSACWLRYGIAAAPDDDEMREVAEAIAALGPLHRDFVRNEVETALGEQRRREANAVLAKRVEL